TPLTFPASDLLANDSPGPAGELGQTLMFNAVSSASAQGGTVSASGGMVTYNPRANFSGMDSFTYTIVDNGAPCGIPDCRLAEGTVNVTVVPAASQMLAIDAGPDQTIVLLPHAATADAAINLTITGS